MCPRHQTDHWRCYFFQYAATHPPCHISFLRGTILVYCRFHLSALPAFQLAIQLFHRFHSVRDRERCILPVFLATNADVSKKKKEKIWKLVKCKIIFNFKRYIEEFLNKYFYLVIVFCVFT